MAHPVALFGGTFDPIHIGHLIIAEWVFNELSLQKLYFVPAGNPPHKTGQPITPAVHRLEMVKRSIAHDARFDCLEYEIQKKGKSYTVETLRWFRERFPGARPLYWIIGSDSLLDLPAWHRPEEILTSCQLVVYPRPGFPADQAAEPFRSRAILLNTPEFAFSATTIRQRIRQGISVRYLVPEPAWRYITEKGLYGWQKGPDC
jgi:nicotinate-nucleotide adenylyltransferase